MIQNTIFSISWKNYSREDSDCPWRQVSEKSRMMTLNNFEVIAGYAGKRKVTNNFSINTKIFKSQVENELDSIVAEIQIVAVLS